MPQPPVVFVPGLGGSFNLPVLLDLRGPTLSGWQFPPFSDYGRGFLSTMSRAGYVRDRDLFVAFYDWRKAVADSAATYLVPWIDRARARSATGRVVLVAHSMGGLVARSYVQSATYRNDVERLITLGTPHRGSAQAYYTWEGGELRWDGLANAVLNVYLWYLEHLHPIQTGLDRLRTIRTQAPGLRDLLPIDAYLLAAGPPQRLIPEAEMQQRNLWGAVSLAPGTVATLVARTAVSTITGSGFTTLQTIVVGPPPPSDRVPPPYPDGLPQAQQTDLEGDATVSLRSARLDDPAIHNVPPTAIVHGQLPDQGAPLVLAELDVPVPAPEPVVAAQPRLLVMTASPVRLTLTLPREATVATSRLAPARRRRVQTFRWGHRGKRLGLAIVPDPPIGSYRLRLRGTATGSFSLGAAIVFGRSGGGSIAPMVEAERQPFTETSTVEGQVAATTQLYFELQVRSLDAPPELRLDVTATLLDAAERLSTLVRADPLPGARGMDVAAELQTVLDRTAPSADLRSLALEALADGDRSAREELARRLLASQQVEPGPGLLHTITSEVVAPRDPTLALGLLEQLRQVAAGA